jgi:hypothetical protein
VSGLRTANLAVRFVIELCALAALAYCGYEAEGWLLAIALPLAGAVIWGLVVSPKRKVDSMPLRIAGEALVLGGAAVALIATEQVWLGVALAVAAVANRVLMAVWGQ